MKNRGKQYEGRRLFFFDNLFLLYSCVCSILYVLCRSRLSIMMVRVVIVIIYDSVHQSNSREGRRDGRIHICDFTRTCDIEVVSALSAAPNTQPRVATQCTKRSKTFDCGQWTYVLSPFTTSSLSLYSLLCPREWKNVYSPL